MKGNIKKMLAMTLALTISAGLFGCGEDGGKKNDSKAENSSAAESSEVKEKEPVVETIGDFDLSDLTSEYDVPADFELTIEGESGEMVNQSFVMDKAFAGDFSGVG